MNVQFSLELADIRLLQTWHLLRIIMEESPDAAAIERALEAIGDARETIASLLDS